jgi:squalene-hopene/tetraprenyl-beta-curcumene cyclase
MGGDLDRMIANKDGGVPRHSSATIAARSPLFRNALSGDEVDRALTATQRHLLDSQHPDGYWVGELEGDTILESEYILLMAYLGREKEDVCAKACKYLHDHQLPGGGWAIYPGGPVDVSASVKAYFALKICGMAIDHPTMTRAKLAILEAGGAHQCNSFTRFYLALLGQIPHADCPSVPPELVLLPSKLGFSLSAMSSWTRTILVPLSIISALKPVRTLPPELGIAELFRTDLAIPSSRTPAFFSWTNTFLAIDNLLKVVERVVPASARRFGLRAAHRWIVDHMENTDGLGAIFPPMIYSVVALKCLGYDDNSPLVRWALAKLEELLIEEDGSVRVQPCLSPVWDTAISTIALADSGLPDFHPALLRSVRWMLDKEVRRPGDWHVRRPGVEPTGWYFQFQNELYPDIDDTAMVVLALARTSLADDPDVEQARQRAVRWILAMQNRDGGWAAFDADIDNQVLTKVPFADHNAILDPSCADITARVLEMLGSAGYDSDDPAVGRALDYLWKTQEPEGCWYGRWGVNYIYGTWQVLLGLAAVNVSMNHPRVQMAADWLESTQQPGGGWGESCQSYDDPTWMGRGNPTASQTAWAVLGLIAAGRAKTDTVRLGVQFLLDTQSADGTWAEDEFTGTGFPRVFYLKYHLYRIYFPLMALGRYRAAAGRVPTANPGVLATRIPALPLAREL